MNPQKDETVEAEKSVYTLPDGNTLEVGLTRLPLPLPLIAREYENYQIFVGPADRSVQYFVGPADFFICPA